MIYIESLLVALSTYSRVPVPQFEWNDRNMKYAICFFPVVGVICGAVLYAWYSLCIWLELSGFLFAAFAACVPLLVTGGIHMDGYMDTMDALSSHQSRERMLQIMKDPNCGAFSVIYCAVYLLVQTGFLYELYEAKQILALCPAFILSRALSALGAISLPKARKDGMLHAFTKDAQKRITKFWLIIWLLISACAMLSVSLSNAVPALVLAGSAMLFYVRIAMKKFGGATGDTTGFCLQICEMSLLIGVCVGGIIL